MEIINIIENFKQHPKERCKQRGIWIYRGEKDIITGYGTARKRPGHATEYTLTRRGAIKYATERGYWPQRLDKLIGKSVLIESDNFNMITGYKKIGRLKAA
jgi:hypothetical protein